ncbi:hypothetical protein AAVH_25389 [Aphelenchoides avenae]|nr:hypothetical protein AAVH_25389 [Aphelenchus avenae]
MRLLLFFTALLASVVAAKHRTGPSRTDYQKYKTTITGRLVCPPTGIFDKIEVDVDMSLEIRHRGSHDSVFINQTVVGTREFRFVAEDIDLVRSSRSRRLRFHVSGYGCAQKNFGLGTPDMAGTTIDGTIVEFFFIGDIPADGYDKRRRPKLLFPITEN